MSEAPSILQKIFADRRRRVRAAKERSGGRGILDTERKARDIAGVSEAFRLSTTLGRRNAVNVIAEFKRASPSKGIIEPDADPAKKGLEYEKCGAAAISVLTEEDHFFGGPGDLKAIVNAVEVPVLRKDFIFDPYQVYESRALGADALLLIAAMLDDDEIVRLIDLSRSLGMDALVEVHDESELARAAGVGATLIGVNNRDLNTFDVSLDVSHRLVRERPPGSLMVAESGICSRDDLTELRDLGFDGFLIGEAAMRNGLGALMPETEAEAVNPAKNKQ